VAPAPESALTRRSFLRKVVALGTVVAVGSVIEACSAIPSSSPTEAPTPAETAEPPTTTPVVTSAPSPTGAPTPEGELRIYNWDGYIADDTIVGFERRYGIKVRYDTFIDEPTQLETLRAPGSGGYDVTYAASTAIPSLVQGGLVRPIDRTLVPHLANLAPGWQSPGYDPGNGHSVPNYWWTVGYAWDPGALSGDLAGWADLWSQRAGRRLAMLDDMRQAFAAAAFALGLSPNTTDDGELDRLLAKLQELKPLVRSWTSDPIGEIDAGDVWLTQCTSRDWSQLTADLPEARFVIPVEGAVRGNDAMVVLASAAHPVAAHLWLDYNLDPQVAANNSNAIGAMTSNGAAIGLLDPSIGGDPRLNPPADVASRLHDLLPLAPADLEKYTTRWELLRAPAG
jgi:spermidine/putrescine transport system substrate-binding protein